MCACAPTRRAPAPRTKDRPTFKEAIRGRVITVDRGRWSVVVDEGTKKERTLIAARAKELRRTAIVTGDFVDLVGDTSGAKDTLARIVRLGERTSILRRSADDTDPSERVVVANAQQLVIVVAAANPEPRTGFIDRAVVVRLMPVSSRSVHYEDRCAVPAEPAGLLCCERFEDCAVFVFGWFGAEPGRGLPVWSRHRCRSFCRSYWVRCRCFWAIRVWVSRPW